MKAKAITCETHNPYDESHWVSRLRENFTSGSDGEGLETDRKAPRQSFTRQSFFKVLKQNFKIKTFVSTSENAVKIQVWTALIAILLLKSLKFMSSAIWHFSALVTFLKWNLFVYCDLQQCWINRSRNRRNRYRCNSNSILGQHNQKQGGCF